jgi:hypothetical protein
MDEYFKVERRILAISGDNEFYETGYRLVVEILCVYQTTRTKLNSKQTDPDVNDKHDSGKHGKWSTEGFDGDISWTVPYFKWYDSTIGDP